MKTNVTMNRFYAFMFVIAGYVLPVSVSAQSTWAQVHQIMTTHCGGYACHDGSTPIFNVNVSADSLYHQLINTTPINPAAAAKNNKIIVPGEPHRSFLMRKISNGISDGLNLKLPDEGVYMPNGLTALNNNEIELVRQWILYAAPDTGNVVDTALINTYYREGGIDDTYSPHDPPAAGTGFQMYLGRIFLPPNTEHEYFIKYDPSVSASTEVPKLVSMMPSGTHHFLLFTFNPGTDVNYPAGLREAADGSMPDVQNGLGTGPGLWTYQLPHNCAYFWASNLKFDVNFHVKNSSLDSIMSTDLYVNVYTQSVGTAQHYMKSINFPNFDITIPQDGQFHSFTQVGTDSSATNSWKIWCLYSHTHKYGTAFNIYKRNNDGSRGEMVYNGNYSYEQGFDVGYYRTGPHSTFRYYPDDSLLEVNPLVGMVGEATWKNTAGPNPVNWGLTSDEEMMVFGFQYIDGGDLTAINTPTAENHMLHIFPNPASNQFAVAYELQDAGNVQVQLFDMLGNNVGVLSNGEQTKGPHTQIFNSSDYHLAPGIYFINFTVDGKTTTEKLSVY